MWTCYKECSVIVKSTNLSRLLTRIAFLAFGKSGKSKNKGVHLTMTLNKTVIEPCLVPFLFFKTAAGEIVMLTLSTPTRRHKKLSLKGNFWESFNSIPSIFYSSSRLYSRDYTQNFSFALSWFVNCWINMVIIHHAHF